jgi:hypothetical protein
VLQGFRFADALKRVVAQDVLNQEVDAFECAPVLALPVEVVFPAAGRPG